MKLFPDSVLNNSIQVYTAGISVKTRIIYWIVILSMVTGLICLPLISVDISVQARGLFQAEIEKQIINAPVNGRVAYAGIQTGNKVDAGDTIFIMDAKGLMAQFQALESIFNENSRSVRDLEILTLENGIYSETSGHALHTSRYISELASFKRKLEIQNHKYQNSKTEYRRSALLFKQNVISAADYENSLIGYKLEGENLEQIKLIQLAQWQNDLAFRNDEAGKLKAEMDINTEEIRYRIVVSPVSGTIIQSADIQKGSFIAAGQKIAEISPSSDLVAVFFVSPADIGFIKKGQRVRLQVDAYNYHQWGMLEGEILEISDDLISDNATAYFRIKCRPEKSYLSLRNGVTSEIMKGMTFTARIMVTRRSLLNLLFDKADKWFNPYTGNNQQANADKSKAKGHN
jgi:membrane fusion protein, peptide pheromone/bacteriocin exporter